MRAEHIDWDRRVYCSPESTPDVGVRWVPLSDRVVTILRKRFADRTKERVWQSRYKGKHIGAAMVNRRWCRAREKVGLPRDLVAV